MPTQRALKDKQFIGTAYLPAAAATNYSGSFDLEAVAGAGDPSLFDLEVAMAAAPNFTDNSKTILITLQDSAAGSSFADVSPLHQCQIIGVTSTGSVATTWVFRPPPGVKRYIRCSQLVPSGGGDNTAVLVTYSLLF